MAAFVSYVQTENCEEVFGLDDILFTPNVLYRNNGFMVSVSGQPAVSAYREAAGIFRRCSADTGRYPDGRIGQNIRIRPLRRRSRHQIRQNGHG